MPDIGSDLVAFAPKQKKISKDLVPEHSRMGAL
jgi:hypothetical protein